MNTTILLPKDFSLLGEKSRENSQFVTTKTVHNPIRTLSTIRKYVQSKDISKVHFLTIRPHIMWFTATYFQNKPQDSSILLDKYLELLNSVSFTNRIKVSDIQDFEIIGSCERNDDYFDGIHLHLIIIGCSALQFRKIQNALIPLFTIQHLYKSKQFAVLPSDKDSNWQDKGIPYFLGLSKSDKKSLKTSYSCMVSNLNLDKVSLQFDEELIKANNLLKEYYELL